MGPSSPPTVSRLPTACPSNIYLCSVTKLNNRHARVLSGQLSRTGNITIFRVKLGKKCVTLIIKNKRKNTINKLPPTKKNVKQCYQAVCQDQPQLSFLPVQQQSDPIKQKYFNNRLRFLNREPIQKNAHGYFIPQEMTKGEGHIQHSFHFRSAALLLYSGIVKHSAHGSHILRKWNVAVFVR